MIGESIQLSARSTDSRVHIGEVLNDAFGDVGSAGGHQEMAGGEISLGIFADATGDDEAFLDIVEQVVTAQLIAGLNIADEPEKRRTSGE